MRIKDLSCNKDSIIHSLECGEFSEKSFLSFDEENAIVAQVVESVCNNQILNGIIYDKKMANKFLLVAYTKLATSIGVEGVTDKEILDVVCSNKIDKIYYKSPNYIYLYDWILGLLEEGQKYNTTFIGAVETLMNKLPEQLEQMKYALDNIDSEKVDSLKDSLYSISGGKFLN